MVKETFGENSALLNRWSFDGYPSGFVEASLTSLGFSETSFLEYQTKEVF
jgi:hypothetical protein